MNDNLVSIALYEVLAGAAAITNLLAHGADSIYEDQAEENADRPLLIYGEMSGVPTYALGDGLTEDDFLYQVKAVADGSSAKGAAEIRDVVEGILSGATLTIPGRNVIDLAKISNIRATENVAGTRYNHRGAIYRIETENE